MDLLVSSRFNIYECIGYEWENFIFFYEIIVFREDIGII